MVKAKTVRITLSALQFAATTPVLPNVSVFPVTQTQHFLIQGKTHAGKTFRPSDWAERLAGVLAPFRPGYSRDGATNPYAQPTGFSPYAQPVVVEGVKAVVVDSRLAELEPMAWEFVVSFARDNDLPMTPASLVSLGLASDPGPASPAA